MTSHGWSYPSSHTHGWPYPFRQRPWDEIDTFLGDVAPDVSYLSAIVKSVIDSEKTAELAGCTSMFDLMVVSTPVPDPPYGVVIVRSLYSHRPPMTGHVRIEHLSRTGYHEDIKRPQEEAVPLFWRFMMEKFGVSSGQ